MKYTIVVSVYKDEAVLEETLLGSPAIERASQVMVQRGFDSVALAYNAAMRESDDDCMVFVHPDVYLPRNWHDAFERSIEWLEVNDPEWGLLGLYGVAADGTRHGFIFSTGMGSFLGVPFATPKEIRTVDEFLFVLRRSSGLTFDEKLPTAQNHLAASDICMEAERRQMHSYVLPCFAVHNSNRWSFLPLNFWKSYLYIRRKWSESLPIEAPYTKVTRGCGPMFKSILGGFLQSRSDTLRGATRVRDPEALYRQLSRDMSLAFGVESASDSK